jgi:branched-chain amino acid transport system ATP-binding protein
MLDLRDVAIDYGATSAVRGIDLQVGTGEVVCLLGPNGAGKTSVLKAVSGLVGYRGSISFDGVEIRSTSPTALARAGLIHVPEGRHVFPTLSVAENLKMGDTARGRRPVRYRHDDVYDLFPPLQHMRRRKAFALSGGEQQMLAIGRALVAAPRLLLLDEPSLGLAPAVTRTVYRALAEITGQTPVLLVEQSTANALALADRGVVLVSGRITLAGSADQLTDRQSIVASYLGQRDAEDRDPHAFEPPS